tara:strand:+ start:5780 stop:5926 length:147 start_codon:yes stop_codon:yes gene_type:complete
MGNQMSPDLEGPIISTSYWGLRAMANNPALPRELLERSKHKIQIFTVL